MSWQHSNWKGDYWSHSYFRINVIIILITIVGALICSDVSVTLSLFDSQAVSFHRKLEGMRVDSKVIVATNINPKMVGGNE